MPEELSDIWAWFHLHAECSRYVEYHAVIEKVGGFIANYSPTEKYKKGQGVGAGPAMFNFGACYGALQMALVASFGQERSLTVTPRAWQGGLGISPRKKSESTTDWKNRLKSVAQSLFPDTQVTLKTADALLIAEYCRRLYG